MTKHFAFRRNSLTHLGRSAALIVGTQDPKRRRPDAHHQGLDQQADPAPFRSAPAAAKLHDAIDAASPRNGLVGDVHGSAPYKRHLTYYYAEQIRAELAAK